MNHLREHYLQKTGKNLFVDAHSLGSQKVFSEEYVKYLEQLVKWKVDLTQVNDKPIKHPRLLRKILKHKPKNDLFYPEHKPLYDKLVEMRKDHQYIYNILIRDKDKLKEYYRKDEPKWKTIYRWLDWDITEEYIWYMSANNLTINALESFVENKEDMTKRLIQILDDL